VLGCAGIASYHLCTFCTLKWSDIECLDPSVLHHHIGAEVIAATEQWRQAPTKKKQKDIFKQYGVQWSSLHQLSYRDPVHHTVLGIMHNWLEGVLQHHIRILWGIEGNSVTSGYKMEKVNNG